MRVHRLEITAFGPFADRQVIDFDPLNAAGVFLLTGLTGAGKTSILDAICFGLFGQVPGVRDKAKTYRSHHAPPGVAPLIVLEVTLRGRRLRLTRHAPWSRPSRRARSGSVEEKARATAEELVDGAWVVRSSRADEVGHLVSGLLGLNREQFCQVVMLPQGEFQAFLRARGRDRQHILESLFGTQRFQAVERWLAEHRRLQSRRCREQEEALGRLVARLQEATAGGGGDPLPSMPESGVDYPQLLGAVRRLVESGRAAVASTAGRAEAASTRSKQAQHALDEARTLAEHQVRFVEARRGEAALLATKDLVAAREESLRRARVAEPLLPLVRLVDEAEVSCSRAGVLADRALARSAGIPGLPDSDLPSVEAIGQVLAGQLVRVARLKQLAVVESDCEVLQGDLDACIEARTSAARVLTDLQEQITNDPGVIAILRTELAAVSAVVAAGADAGPKRERANQVLAAVAEVQGFDDTLKVLQAQRLEAREAAAAAAESWLEAREHYLAGLAAELAGTLVDEQACPVCGSTSHPSPALPEAQHVTRRRETELLTAVTIAREAVTRLDDRIVETERVRGAGLARSGGFDVAQALAAVAAASDNADTVAAAVAEHRHLTRTLDTLVASADARRARREQAVAEIAQYDERAAGCQRQLDEKRAQLRDEVGPDGRAHDLLARILAEVVVCRELDTAVRARDDADRSAAQARAQLTVALDPAEFDTAQAVREAALPAVEIANADALNRAYAAELGALTRVLADPVVAAAAAEPIPDLAALEAGADSASLAAAGSNAVASDVKRRQARLEELLVELEVGVAELVPLRAAKDLADDVAGLCAGTSPDNPTRTALSHYVLSARLGQVVAAANVRLDSICSGRYQLSPTMAREAGDNRGGLGLVVVDNHTDRSRDPATLSGGETFYVSLSLALGLADVVTQEAGGAELSTLFVDEGFGALDDDTRDEVLDELDELRSGGRTIGLVSHLSELRARFPTQLHVAGGPGGSHCHSVTT